MTDEQIYEALAPIADEEIMAHNKASIIGAGRALLSARKPAAIDGQGAVYVRLFRPSTGDVFKALRADSAGISDLLREGWEIAAAPAEPAQSGEAIYQTRWSHPETVWGDVQKETYDRFETFGYVERRIVYANPQPSQAEKGDEVFEADFLCVDSFAEGMKQKLLAARLKGRRGWQDCDPTELSIMLREHVEKGDPLDVANFCMFLWHLEQPIGDAALPMGRRAAPQSAQTAQSTDSEFKNFHRLLCERFDYTHDDKDWKRDQLSLIEWIAAAPQPELTERAITDEQISLLAAEYSSVLRGSKIGDWDFAFSDYRELTKFARALLAAAQPATEDKP